MSTTDLAALIILDGFALREETKGNAVKQANTPNFDHYWEKYPHTQLKAFGEAVGLPEGQMGNSEVGHLNIGAGRIVYQSLTRINLAIENKDFYKNEALIESMERATMNDQAVHVFGLLSDGGVHSHIDHLLATLTLAKEQGVKDVYVHAFLDGRDVGPQTAKQYIEQAEAYMNELGIGKIATVSGRYYAMDRDQRWERTKKAFDAIVYGEGPAYEKAKDVINDSYQQEVSDEFVIPSVITDQNGNPVGRVKDGDSVIFVNFRPDRAIQLSQSFANEDFNAFNRGSKSLTNVDFVMFTEYSDTIEGKVAFAPTDLTNTVGEVLAQHGKKQIRIAETEKYPHVTYFMSGGIDKEFPGEKRILIDSPKVATYDLQPEMSAYEVTDALIHELNTEVPHAIILNFANPDMVGHSGKLQPTIDAVEAVDECLGKIVDKILSLGGKVIITADHGNADEVTTLDDKPMTAHTTNPVPVIVTDEHVQLQDGGILADLAPTLLDLLGIKQPKEMTGSSLIKS